ncbi:MAG TPA: hypothetical protein VFQ53_29250 [Kofleriaceae bacterium]|nr:hypothetical protein [Kofleriaceae bacterium]
MIDLGPSDPAVRRQLAAALVAAGLEPVVGDGVEDALAGDNVDRDAVQLAAAVAEAQRAFGALDCKAATTASQTAIGLAAARQAAGLPVPELARALTYVLLCADRAGDLDTALRAATNLRTVGGSPDVPADVWKKYPEIDVVPAHERFALAITADPGAAVYLDFRRVGTAPLTLTLTAGDHVIAAATATRRGWAAGTAVRTQTQLAIPMADLRGTWAEVAQRVASWRGAMPAPPELGWVMAKVHARVVLVRKGDRVEAWGRLGLAEAPHQLGGDDGVGTLAEADRLAALVVDRVHGWNDRAPDPDRPLLVEDRTPGRTDRGESPTKWWVYASVIGAVAAAAVLVYANDAGSDHQRIEVHAP